MIYLHSLYVRKYKILEDFELFFDAGQLNSITVLIGTNGAGKSTILECLTWIFRGLHEKYSTHQDKPVAVPFDFELVYLHSHTSMDWATVNESSWNTVYTEVRVKGVEGKVQLSLPRRTNTPSSEPAEWVTQTNPKEAEPFIPNVVVYYAGLSETIRQIYKPFERAYLVTSRRKGENQERADSTAIVSRLPLFYYDRNDFSLILAGLYLFRESGRLDDFFRRINLHRPEHGTIQLAIRRNTYAAQGSDRDIEHLWGAEGALRRLLGLLLKFATSQEKASTTKPAGRYTNGLVLTFDLEAWRQMREAYGSSERDLFAQLLQLRAGRYLDSADLTVYYERDNFKATHAALSEGEQQRIIMRGLCELLVNENSLLLLDEPDTYQHPQWQSAIMNDLEEYKEFMPSIIATHSPVMLSNLNAGNIFLQKQGQAYIVSDPVYGLPYESNLTGPMKTERRPQEIDEKIKEIFRAIDKKEWPIATMKLGDLRAELHLKDDSNDPDILRAAMMLRLLQPAS